MLLERDARRRRPPDGSATLLEGLAAPARHRPPRAAGSTSARGRRDRRAIRFDAEHGAHAPASYERVVTGLPAGGNHWTRTVRFGPTAGCTCRVGSSCNVCVEEDARRAALLRFRAGRRRGGEIFATRTAQRRRLRLAARNRRALRDRQRPRPARRRLPALRAEPRRRGGRSTAGPSRTATACPTRTSAPATSAEIATSLPPAHGFRAHNAPLGIAFLRSERSRAGSRGARARRAARLVEPHAQGRLQGRVAALEPDGRSARADFLSGFLPTSDVIGRPVDVAEGRDGAVYVSDDYAGAIYRVARSAAQRRQRRSAHRTRGRRPARRPRHPGARGRERARRGSLERARLRGLSRRGAGYSRRRPRGAARARPALRHRCSRDVPERPDATDAGGRAGRGGAPGPRDPPAPALPVNPWLRAAGQTGGPPRSCRAHERTGDRPIHQA